MQQHINEGIDEPNSPQFSTYTSKRARKKMAEIIKEAKDREMPLTSRLLSHHASRGETHRPPDSASGGLIERHSSEYRPRQPLTQVPHIENVGR